MDLENKISKKNKIPGCDQLTRPEEIQALSKYLGEIRKDQKQLEKETFKGLDKLFVPGKTTGKFPNVTLGDHIEALDVKQIDSLSNSKVEMPGDFKNVELSKEKIKLEDNNNLQLDKTLIALKTNNNVDELETKLLKIKNDSKINSLSDKVIELDAENNVSLDNKSVKLSEGDFKNTSLDNKQIKLDVNKTLESLDSKRVDLDVNQEINLETKKEELNVTSVDNLSNKKVNLNNIEDVDSLSDKKIKLKNTSPIVSLEDKMLELIGEQKSVILEDKVVKPINDLSSEVTSLYDTIDSKLKLVDDGVDELEDKLVDAPDSTTKNNIDHIKQNLSEIKGDINIKLEGEALKYFEKIKKKLIIQGDKIGAFNTVMSLYKDLQQRDQAHSDLWEKIIAVLSTYGATELPKANKESSEEETEDNFHKKKVNVLSNTNTKKDSAFNNYFTDGTTLNENKKVSILESENNDQANTQDKFINASAVSILPDNNQSASLSYSYLSSVIQYWKETGSISSKSWLSEFSSSDNKLISSVANFGINCLSNLQKKWSTSNNSSNNGNSSNSSSAGNRLKWSLPGASTTNVTTAEGIIGNSDILGSALSMAESYGADALTGDCSWVEKTEEQYKNKPIKYEYENSTLSEIDTSNLKDNAYYKVGNKVYRWEKNATTNFKALGKSFETYAKGVAGEFKTSPKSAINSVTNTLFGATTSDSTNSTIVYNRPKANGKTTTFEFPTDNPSIRKTSVEKINSNLVSYTAKDNNSKNKGSSYLVLNGGSEKLNLNPNSKVFKDRYISSYGIQTTLKELCNSSKVSSVEDLKSLLLNSEYITTINRVGTSSVNNRFAQTLDSNGCWEIVMEPFVSYEMNGGFSYLPAIQEINTINLAEHGINTGYNKWIPISSFGLQKAKLNSKSISLFDGEFSVPLAAELVNDLTISIIDDQYKSWRNYFQKVMDVSVYNSTPHDENYYKTGYDTVNLSSFTRNMTVSGKESMDVKEVKKQNINLVNNTLNSNPQLTSIYSGQWMPTAVDKNAECTALYKNVTFRIKIYVMTQQYSTIRKFDLLAVLRDFSEEFSGDTDYSAGDLNLSFSIVGEDPDHYKDPMKYSQTIQDWWKTTDEYYEEKKLALRLKTVEGTTEQVDDKMKKLLIANEEWEKTKKTEKTLAVKAAIRKQQEEEAAANKDSLVIYTCLKPDETGYEATVTYTTADGKQISTKLPTSDINSICMRNFSTVDELVDYLNEHPELNVINDAGFINNAYITSNKEDGKLTNVTKVSIKNLTIQDRLNNWNENSMLTNYVNSANASESSTDDGNICIIRTTNKEYASNLDTFYAICDEINTNYYGSSSFNENGNLVSLDITSEAAKANQYANGYKLEQTINNQKELIQLDLMTSYAENKAGFFGTLSQADDSDADRIIAQETKTKFSAWETLKSVATEHPVLTGLAVGGVLIAGAAAAVMTGGLAVPLLTSSFGILAGGAVTSVGTLATTALAGAAYAGTGLLAATAISTGAVAAVGYVEDNIENPELYGWGDTAYHSKVEKYYDQKDSQNAKEAANLVVNSSSFTNKDFSEMSKMRSSVFEAQDQFLKDNPELKEELDKNNVQLGNDYYENYRIIQRYGKLNQYVTDDGKVYRPTETNSFKEYSKAAENYASHCRNLVGNKK